MGAEVFTFVLRSRVTVLGGLGAATIWGNVKLWKCVGKNAGVSNSKMKWGILVVGQ